MRNLAVQVVSELLLLLALLQSPVLSFEMSKFSIKQKQIFERSSISPRFSTEEPASSRDNYVRSIKQLSTLGSFAAIASLGYASLVCAEEGDLVGKPIDYSNIKLPYNHVNYPCTEFFGKKATIVFNLKLDDPQTGAQFPSLIEIYNKYKSQGLNVLCFPSEQGWAEPDDDEALKAKGTEYFGFGDYPHAVLFDKVDVLGPSAHPFYNALTRALPTPNGYGRITLNYEKFLLDSKGMPLRRYPRKFSAYDFEDDIVALLNDQPLPAETPQFQKIWREAKREVLKSEYAFRYNYNYYTAPDSMYKYDPKKDVV